LHAVWKSVRRLHPASGFADERVYTAPIEWRKSLNLKRRLAGAGARSPGTKAAKK